MSFSCSKLKDQLDRPFVSMSPANTVITDMRRKTVSRALPYSNGMPATPVAPKIKAIIASTKKTNDVRNILNPFLSTVSVHLKATNMPLR